MSSLGRADESRDVLQKTNVNLWRNCAKFDEAKPFLPWALTLARFQILGYLRDRKRERVLFDSDVLEQMQTASEARLDELPMRQIFLRKCLGELQEEHQTLLSLRYAHRKSIAHLAKVSNRSEDGVKSLLLRLRKTLGRCIESKINNSPEIS